MADETLEIECEWKVCIEMAKAKGEKYYSSFLECYSKKMKEDHCDKCDGKTQKICYIPERKLNYKT